MWAKCGIVLCAALCSGSQCDGAQTDTEEDAVSSQQGVAEKARVREPTVSGAWYPSAPANLSQLVDKLLASAEPVALHEPVRALVVPHAGYRFSGSVAAHAYRTVQGQRYERVIVLGTAHRGGFKGASILDATHYRTPLGDIALDMAAIAELREHPLVGSHRRAHAREHSIEIQLPLLQAALDSDWKLLPMLVSRLDPGEAEQLALALRPFADESTLVVASGDFTHYGPNYGYTPFASDDKTQERLRSLDEGAISALLSRDAEALAQHKTQTGITVCGFYPFLVLTHLVAADNKGVQLRYETSGALTGDFTNSVSYVAAAFVGVHPPATAARVLSQQELATLHKLAVRTVERVVRSRERVDPEELLQSLEVTAKLRKASGAFVTLKKKGQLRGCIGVIEPRHPLWRAVVQSAVSAAAHDRRFAPVALPELDELTVEVSVLSPPQPVPSYDAFRVGLHGIVLEKRGRRAVYLPEVATEQGWTREQTLSHLSRKAGLPRDAWKTGASFQVFTSQIFEAPFAIGM